MSVIGEWLKEGREAKGWSQSDLAYEWRAKFGIKLDPRRVGAWERGENEPSLRNSSRLSELLDRPLPLEALRAANHDMARYLGETGWPIPDEPLALTAAAG